MGKEMTARNEGCLRGLREREEGWVEAEGEPNSRRCSPGQEDRPLLFSFSLSSVVSLLQIQFNSLLCLCLFRAHKDTRKSKEEGVKWLTVKGLVFILRLSNLPESSKHFTIHIHPFAHTSTVRCHLVIRSSNHSHTRIPTPMATPTGAIQGSVSQPRTLSTR